MDGRRWALWRLPSGRGCRVTAVDSRPLPMDTRCGASVCTRNARPASCTSRPLAAATPAMPASNKSIRVIMNRYGEPAGEGGWGEKGETRRGDDRSDDRCLSRRSSGFIRQTPTLKCLKIIARSSGSKRARESFWQLLNIEQLHRRKCGRSESNHRLLLVKIHSPPPPVNNRPRHSKLQVNYFVDVMRAASREKSRHRLARRRTMVIARRRVDPSMR